MGTIYFKYKILQGDFIQEKQRIATIIENYPTYIKVRYTDNKGISHIVALAENQYQTIPYLMAM